LERFGFIISSDSEAIEVLTSSIKKSCILRFGAWLLVPLQGAAAGCCCRVLLQGVVQGAAVRLWCLVAGAAAGCHCKVPLQGAAAGCRCRVPV